ncbi:uncharacterized protein BDR25DRAFT_98272 [Lindgomyces ingoldianus]|uniref:Uncharacterized protein n=1 Tax=Lindgomyces ingoldianus TaxID=673940 RepID=A0ACB6QBP1_9PLEO|nr:uncharacterized protein BDR25DRAFT_98272 [Lindgomyces ingoldianus]KAF2464326.1 hypothetical protein BDR25DRAFT_98272 [Lindgomyces ingoldianus]
MGLHTWNGAITLGRAWLDHILVEQTFVVLVLLAWRLFAWDTYLPMSWGYFLLGHRLLLESRFMLCGIMGAGRYPVLTAFWFSGSIYSDLPFSFVPADPVLMEISLSWCPGFQEHPASVL